MSEPEPPTKELEVPAVDPRFKRRWAEARRAEGRRRLRVLLILLAVVAVMGAAIGLVYSPVLRVRHVIVLGNAHTPTAQVLVAAGMAAGDRTVLMIDAGPPRAQDAVEALPWVGTATFQRRWPWTVVIRVTERAPVARVVSNGAQELVDRTGRVLEVSPSRIPALPIVIGVKEAPAGAGISPGPGLDQTDLQELLAAAGATPRPLGERKLELAYSPPAGLIAYIGPSRTAVLLGDASVLADKLAILQELASRVNLAGYSQVDLTVPERPALTPLPFAASTPAWQNGVG